MTNTHEILEALKMRGGQQEDLFAAARLARRLSLGNEVTLRGVIEVTNICRVNCDYCPMRRDNTHENDRFSLSEDDIVDSVHAIVEAGIGVVLLQGGETPRVLPVIERALKRITNEYPRLEIILNLGNFSHDQYARLREAGATSYILKHESSDVALFERLRHEPFEERMHCLWDLKSLGFRVGTGLMTGLPGQSMESIVSDLMLAREVGVQMCSVSPFVPAPNTPMEGLPAGDNELALNVIACMRVLFPFMSIPSVSALERTHTGGQRRGLDAGANVLTINFSKSKDREKYLIYGKNRFIVSASHVETIVRQAGMVVKASDSVASTTMGAPV